jgi:hypothetical protein
MLYVKSCMVLPGGHESKCSNVVGSKYGSQTRTQPESPESKIVKSGQIFDRLRGIYKGDATTRFGD